jgi:hypothetical protein
VNVYIQQLEERGVEVLWDTANQSGNTSSPPDPDASDTQTPQSQGGDATEDCSDSGYDSDTDTSSNALGQVGLRGFTSQPGVEATVADFSTSVTSGIAHLTVQFTDQSTGNITSWEWDFNNDGIVDSMQQNPSYAYEISGKYTVSLKVTGPAGSDTKIKNEYITVSEEEKTLITALPVGLGIIGLCCGIGYYFVRRVSKRKRK